MYSEDLHGFGVILGVTLFAEGVDLLCLRPSPDNARSRARRRTAPMLLCTSVMMGIPSGTDLRGWEGGGRTAMLAIGMAGTVATLVSAVWVLRSRLVSRT
jgi:hypothetical protein